MLSTNRSGRGERFSNSQFSETSSTSEVIDITPSHDENIIAEEGRRRTSTDSMERRSSSQRQRFQQSQDTLSLDEMSRKISAMLISIQMMLKAKQRMVLRRLKMNHLIYHPMTLWK